MIEKLYPFNLKRAVRRRLTDCMSRFLKSGDTLCDVGCGTKPFNSFLTKIGVRYLGLDTDNSFYGMDNVDIVATADVLPLADGITDAILSSQVIEHLPDPENAMRETNRVLKPGGLLFISFPMFYPIHAAPFDFFRYSDSGFEALCSRTGFELLEKHEMSGFWFAASIFTDHQLNAFNRSFIGKFEIVKILALPLHWLFWLIHSTESLVHALLGKSVANTRKAWTTNYVYVARKTPPNP